MTLRGREEISPKENILTRFSQKAQTGLNMANKAEDTPLRLRMFLSFFSCFHTATKLYDATRASYIQYNGAAVPFKQVPALEKRQEKVLPCTLRRGIIITKPLRQAGRDHEYLTRGR